MTQTPFKSEPFPLNSILICVHIVYVNPLPTDDEPSDDVLRQCARLVAQQTKNWARLALYLGLLPADAANAQHYQVQSVHIIHCSRMACVCIASSGGYVHTRTFMYMHVYTYIHVHIHVHE